MNERIPSTRKQLICIEIYHYIFYCRVSYRAREGALEFLPPRIYGSSTIARVELCTQNTD